MKKTIICLVGPTASGKTAIALALAKKINAEIISCDSMQVYQGVDIASAKPTPAQRKKIAHHLLDVVRPSQEYNAERFRCLAEKIITQIHHRRKIPLIVAGTGLYLRALLDGIFTGPGQNRAVRKQITELAQQCGCEYCYKKLRQIDPVAAAAIHPHDLRRIIRALEVYQLSGKTITELKKGTRGIREKYTLYIFGLMRPRDELYRRIEQRVGAMFKKGLVKEIERLAKQRISKTARSLLGYKQVLGFIQGEYSRDEAKRLLALHTRRYAKRQMTWFRREKDIKWIEVGANDSVKAIVEKIRAFLV